MKKADIKIGGRYVAKVSGKITTVKVLERHIFRGRDGFRCRSDTSGRAIVCSAARLRRPAPDPAVSPVVAAVLTALAAPPIMVEAVTRASPFGDNLWK